MPAKKKSGFPVEPVSETISTLPDISPLGYQAPVNSNLVEPPSKPGMVQAIAIITLVSGILSILCGFFWLLGLLPTIVCWPLSGYPIAVGILEIVQAAKHLQDHPIAIKPARYLAIMEICEILFLNPFSLIAGILVLAFQSDPGVKDFYTRINDQSLV